MSTMHVLLIHQAFVSGQEAGGTRHYELGRHLVEWQHRLTVIASPVSYLTGRITAESRGRGRRRGQVDGIEIIRAWAYTGRHRSFFARLLSFLSFMVLSFVGALRVKRVDVVWGTTPPIFQAVTAYLVARLKHAPFLLEVRDLWPDFAVEVGVLRNPLLIWASRRLERFLYRHADRLLVNSPGFIPHLRECDVPEEKIDVIPNGVDVSMFDPADRGEEVRRELGLEDTFIALYAGAHGIANDLGTILLAAKRLEQQRDIVFVLVGDGKERSNLIRQAGELRLSNVRFAPAQPKARMPAFLAAADVCIAILRAIPMFTTTYPNKVFDYMAAGRATVLAIDGAIRGVVEGAGAGLFVSPGNPEALADAVRMYHDRPELRGLHGARAQAYVGTHFDRVQQARSLEAMLNSLVPCRGIRPLDVVRSKSCERSEE
jgi:glycosyltransferase involved in cell wall biosynthesis